MDNNELFLKLTREFERLYQQKYHNNNYSAYYIYKIDKYFEKYIYEIDLIRKIRNLLSHQREINHKDTFSVNQNIIESIKKLINLLSLPLNAISICAKNVLVAKEDDKVILILNKMFAKGLSYVPIINQVETIGVISSAGLINYLMHNPNSNINELVVKDIKDEFSLVNHPSMYFSFISPDEHISDLKEMFKKIKYNKKLALLIITNNGLNSNKIMGVVSPIDLVEK